MKLSLPGRPHLTYCTNIHPGESWAEVRANLERYVLPVRAKVAPGRPFGVGLRLSARAAEELHQPAALEALLEFLAAHELYVFTINGFPYGQFHGEPVKDRVYLPDWLDDARLVYTDRLAAILAAVLPDEAGLEGSISTVPGAYKERITGPEQVGRMAERLMRHAATLHRLREETGKLILLALEPEPCCYLETTAETIRFFEDYLFAEAAVARFAALTGLGRSDSESVLRRHLGVCFDVCHMAVEFEDPQASLEVLRAAGIRIGKIQLSAALRVAIQSESRAQAEALSEFADDVYLHQVVERRGEAFRRFTDLPGALQTLQEETPEPREWRIHFHVPLFRRELGSFANTQGYLAEVLGLLRQRAYTQHLEVETYTWGVLPEAYRAEDIVSAVARELHWVLEHTQA